MAKKEKYEDLANSIIDLAGGKENITFFTHCVTRLRINVKDKSLVKVKEIEKIEHVMGCQWAGEQLQIIIGQSVGEAYKLICEKTGFTQQNAIQENLDGGKKKFNISTVLDILSGCISPIIPAFCGAGVIKILLTLLPMLGLLQVDSSTYQVLNFMGDAVFYFLPVLLGSTAARKLGVNEALGMLLGGILIAPNFVSGVSAGTAFSFLGIPIYGVSYCYTMFPIIFCVAVMAPVYKFFNKIIPKSLSTVLVPFLTIIIMAPLSLCAIAPIGSIFGDFIGNAIIWLYGKVGPFAVAAFAGIYPWLTLTGMHGGLTPYMITMLTTVGYEPIYVPGMVISNINLGVVSLAVSLKTKNKNLKSEAIGYGITSLFGSVCEPALYGIAVRYKKPLIAVTIANVIAGFAMGLLNVRIYAFPGTAALFSVPIFLNEMGSGIIPLLACWIIGGVISFIITYVTYKDESVE